MPQAVFSLLTPILERITGQTGPLQLRRLGGGSINEAFQVVTSDNSAWFCKINEAAPFPDLFQREKEGLQLLESQHIFRVPAVLACEQADGMQVLLMEYIGPGSDAPSFQEQRPSPGGPDFWSVFGEQLARLHKVSRDNFGLDRDNYMASLIQHNQAETNWVDFLIHQRLEPQVRLAAEKNLLGPRDVQQFRRLYKALPGIFEKEAPSLVHGDLWSGNYLIDNNGQPVLIDPAVYYGHRSMDLAMTILFGGFEPRFYESYHYHFPFPSNYRQQWEICNLYPLLVHVNLFGESYLPNILSTIQPF